MRNIDWLCENDREALVKIIAEGDECEYCAFEIEDDCGIRCSEGMLKWFEAEHSDGVKPEKGVSAEGVDANDAKVIRNGEKYKLADGDTREKLEDVLRNHAVIAFADKESGNDGILMRLDEFRALLDRQKAIAEREQAERIRQLEQDFQTVKDDRDDCCREIAKLTVERDNLELRVSNCQERIRQLEQVVQADKEDCAQSFADMKVMENQRDREQRHHFEIQIHGDCCAGKSKRIEGCEREQIEHVVASVMAFMLHVPVRIKHRDRPHDRKEHAEKAGKHIAFEHQRETVCHG